MSVIATKFEQNHLKPLASVYKYTIKYTPNERRPLTARIKANIFDRILNFSTRIFVFSLIKYEL